MEAFTILKVQSVEEEVDPRAAITYTYYTLSQEEEKKSE